MTERLPPIDPKRSKALSDEVRIGILELLNRLVSASAPELADQSGLPLNVVSHHLRVLLECECVDVAASRKQGGSKLCFYKVRPGILARPSPFDSLIPKRPVSDVAMEGLARNAASVLNTRKEQDDLTCTFAVETLTLTAAHRQSALEALRLAVTNLLQLQELSRQLSVATDAPLLSLELGVALFEPLEAGTQ